MKSPNKRRKQVDLTSIFPDTTDNSTQVAVCPMPTYSYLELSVEALECLARLKNMEALLREAQHTLPDFPTSLNLVTWAAYNIFETEFAEQIEVYLRKNGFADEASTIYATDTEEARAAKAIASAVQHRANNLAITLLDVPQASVMYQTVHLAASLHMTAFLKLLGMRNVPIFVVKEQLFSMLSVIKQSAQEKSIQYVSWNLIYESVVAKGDEADILKVLEWDKPIQYVISPLITHGYIDLAISLVVDSKAELEAAETLQILESGNIKLLTRLQKALRPLPPKFLFNSNVCDALSGLITRPLTLLDAVYLIRKCPVKYLTIQNISHIIRTLRTLLSFHTENTLIEHWNPMLASVVCAELCCKFSKYHFEFKHTFELMEMKFKNLASSYINKFAEFRKVKLIYTDDSYPGGTLLDIMTNKSSEYRSMLESNLVAAVVEDLWAGTAKSVKMYVASPLYHVYKTKHPNKVFEVHKSKKMAHPVNCYFSFTAWKHSAEMRFWFETLYLLVVLIRVILTIQTYADCNLIIFDWTEPAVDRKDAADRLEEEKFVMWMCLAYFSTVLLHIAYNLVFQRINGVKYRFSKRILIDIGLFAFMLAAIDRVENHPNDTDTIEDLFAVVLMLVFIKGCMIMLITKHFGPVVRSIGIIVMRAMKYIMLFLLSVIAFSLVFYILFYRQDDQFDTLGGSFTALFNFAAGNLDFEIFGDRHDLGVFMTCLWTFVSMITLLNIIVAYITSTYSSMEPQASADYASLLYSSYKTTMYNEAYSALVMYPAPTNIFIVMLSPVYWFMPSALSINKALMAVSYVQMFVFALVLFTLYNLVMIPIVYFRTAIRLLEFVRHGRKYWRAFLKWIAFGLFYEVYLWVISYRFVATLLLYNKGNLAQYELTAEMLQETINVAERLSKDQEDQETPAIVPLNIVVQGLMESDKEKNGFFGNLRGLRRATTKASLNKSVVKDYYLCNQVEFIEQFLWYDGCETHQLVNLTLLQKMVKKLNYNSDRLIPVNVSGIQRALMRFKKKRV